MFYCDRILWGSVLNLTNAEGQFTYEFSIGFDRSCSRELRVRGSDLATWIGSYACLVDTRIWDIPISEVFSMSAISKGTW